MDSLSAAAFCAPRRTGWGGTACRSAASGPWEAMTLSPERN